MLVLVLVVVLIPPSERLVLPLFNGPEKSYFPVRAAYPTWYILSAAAASFPELQWPMPASWRVWCGLADGLQTTSR